MAIKKMNNMKEIGENLRKIREFRGLKQETVAKALNTSAQYISEIERGMHDPSAGLLAQLGELYEVNPGAFFGSNAQISVNSFQQQGGHSNNYIMPLSEQSIQEMVNKMLEEQAEKHRKEMESLKSAFGNKN
jgi:transcriptional regulator with XRE-family HTH domain